MPRRIPDITIRENVGRERMLREAPCAECNRRIAVDVQRYGHATSKPAHGAPGPITFAYYHVECIPTGSAPP